MAPCYNKAHKHSHPTESVEKLGDFWMAIHKAAREANPEAVVELCPCGTVFNFHNLPATDQYPSSDPLSSWQVRSKGKSYKAIIGNRSSFAGDHVELSDNGDDFASSVGVGAVISTKFTWPRDTEHPVESLPPGGYVLTPAKEALWRKWGASTNNTCCPRVNTWGIFMTSASTSPRVMPSPGTAPCITRSTRPADSGKIELRGPEGRELSGTRPVQRSGPRQSDGEVQHPERALRTVPVAAGQTGMTVSNGGASRAWVFHALITVVPLWGVWGALAGLSSRNIGSPTRWCTAVWSLTMIPPALFVLARNGWKLDTSPRAIAYGLTVGLLGAGGQMLLFKALTIGPAYFIFPIISLSGHHHRDVPS